jgi:transcriptional regulator with XRE-family HTH domain
MGRIITLRDSVVNTPRVRRASRAVNNGGMEKFAQRLKRLRVARGLTQEQLAHACGYPGQSRIANYESLGASARVPSLAEIPTLANALGVPETELVASLPESATTAPTATPPEVREIRVLLGLTAKALAASIPGAGRELVDELERVAGPLRKGTFARDFADAVRAELPASHKRSAQKPHAQTRR